MSLPNEYHFITHWRIKSSTAEVYEILSDPLRYSEWWRGVYLRTNELEAGDEDGINQIINLEMRGWLPYTLRWQLKSTELRKPHGFTAESSGDFIGRGIWTFGQDGPWADIAFDWKIRAEKAFLRHFSWLLKPLFIANHNWVMNKWEESLKLELAQRRSQTTQVV